MYEWDDQKESDYGFVRRYDCFAMLFVLSCLHDVSGASKRRSMGTSLFLEASAACDYVHES